MCREGRAPRRSRPGRVPSEGVVVRPARGHALLHHRAMRHAGYPIQEVRAQKERNRKAGFKGNTGACMQSWSRRQPCAGMRNEDPPPPMAPRESLKLHSAHGAARGTAN